MTIFHPKTQDLICWTHLYHISCTCIFPWRVSIFSLTLENPSSNYRNSMCHNLCWDQFFLNNIHSIRELSLSLPGAPHKHL
jgi:hypothetical protein